VTKKVQPITTQFGQYDGVFILTLILSLASQDFVIQVADRRLTNKVGGRTSQDDNKVVLFCNQMAFAYTGLAEIGNTKTDKWLVTELGKLQSRSLSDAILAIRDLSTEAFRKIRLPQDWKRHAFVGAGFIENGTGGFNSCLVRISNFYDRHGMYLPVIRDEFEISYITCETDTNYVYLATGYPLERQEDVQLQRRIRDIGRRRLGPIPVLRTFVDMIRGVSKRLNNKWVGKSLLVIFMPANTINHDCIWVGGKTFKIMLSGPRTKERSMTEDEYLYNPSEGPEFLALPEGANDPVFNGPRIAAPGLPVIHGIKITNEPNNESDPLFAVTASESGPSIGKLNLKEGQIIIEFDWPRIGTSYISILFYLSGGLRGYAIGLEFKDGTGVATLIQMNGLI